MPTLDDRILELEKLYNSLDHGRFERIEDIVTRMEGKLDSLIPLHSKLDADINNMKDDCIQFKSDIDWLKDKRYQDEGGKGLMKWLVPLSIAITGIIVSLITYGIDRMVR